MGLKAQLSAEMLIVLVIVLGLAILLASTMLNSAKDASNAVNKKTGSIIDTCTSTRDCIDGKACQNIDPETLVGTCG